MALLSRRLGREQREQRLASLRTEFLAEARPVGGARLLQTTEAQLALLFTGYDRRFFAGELGERTGAGLSFRWSTRLSSSGGVTRWWRTEQRWEIAIARDLMKRSFSNPGREVRTCGLVCADRLDAVMRIFEHELCHLSEVLETGGSSCKRRPFQGLAEGLFGHREHTHRLVTPREEAHGVGIVPGCRVRFGYAGRETQGVVSRITKRATVLVEDPAGGWVWRGVRVTKIYVPLERLELV